MTQSKPFISFITISLNIEDLYLTYKSIKSTIKICNLKNCITIFVLPKHTQEDIKKIEYIKKFKNSYICFDNNNGIYKALNIGIEKAISLNSSHVCFVNGGDTLEIGFSESVKISKQNPNAVVAGKSRIVFENTRKRNISYQGGIANWNITHQGSIYPTLLFKNNKYMDELFISADWHFNYRNRNKCKFIKLNTIVASFSYGHGISQSKNKYKLLLLDELKVIRLNINNLKYFFNIFYFLKLCSLFIYYFKELIHNYLLINKLNL